MTVESLDADATARSTGARSTTGFWTEDREVRA